MVRTRSSRLALSEHLSFLRHRLGLTQEDFAERAGITYKYYQAIEGGRRADIRLSTLAKLAEAHHMKLSEFFFLMETPGPALWAEAGAGYRAGPRRPAPAGKKARPAGKSR